MKFKKINQILPDILLIFVLLFGIYLRISGLFWGDYQYLHPDERFLIWVTADMKSVDSIGGYFDTENSTLNPHNVGHDFFVYGDFPLIFTRYLLETFAGDQFGWKEVLQFGRGLSTIFDLGAVILIYFIGKRLFNNKWIGLFAAAFSAMAAQQIQQAHFYTVDTFSTFFTTLAVYLAVRIVISPLESKEEDQDGSENQNELSEDWESPKKRVWIFSPHTFVLSILFGITVGLAAASKVNTVTVAILLPVALIALWFRYAPDQRMDKTDLFLRDILIGAVFAILAFRIFQPYAFNGPGFFGFTINQAWMDDLRELQNMSTGDIEFPPAVQWARRDLLFSFKNTTIWGLGLPLGILSWIGFFWIGFRMLKGDWKKYCVLWVWAALYFAWMSSIGNPMMRYQLPVYPLFALMAAWGLVELWNKGQAGIKRVALFRISAFILGAVVLILTGIWAFMFSRIYVVPMTRVAASEWIYDNIPGAINLIFEESTIQQRPLAFPTDYYINTEQPYSTSFSLSADGVLSEISLGRVSQIEEMLTDQASLVLTLYDAENGMLELSSGSLTSSFLPSENLTTPAYTIDMEPDVSLFKNHRYQLVVVYQGEGEVTIAGSGLAIMTNWDENIPVRFDGMDGYGGIYQGAYNFDVFADDNLQKYNQFVSILNQTDYILFSSNRQYGTITRVSERYPLTTGFFRSLLGCPDDTDVITCYNLAVPGKYMEELGFELIQVYESYPHLGEFTINDQFAEEAFSVYDHPKVLIFKKSEDYNPQIARQVLNEYDYEHTVHLTPGKFPDYPADLMLPEDRLVEQQAGGTWSELFNREAIYNQHPILAVLLWYVVLTVFGWFIYPILRYVMPATDDKGYPLSKLAGMLLLALGVWWIGSAGIAVTKGIILAVLGSLAAAGLVFAWIQRKALEEELRTKKKYFILVELISLGLFVFFLMVRVGNPDLWHPSKGGEKPMDFAYFNAVLKSSTYPPYDPWFAGGYINYYYYGFVIVGVFVKLLGIIPSIAYNLILPTLFAFVGVGAFSAAWNLIHLVKNKDEADQDSSRSFRAILRSPAFLAGVAAILLILILGNLGTVRLMWHGLQKLGSPNGVIDQANMFERIRWTIFGIVEFVKGVNFPFYPGTWYWEPSRALPGSAITEFPYFTFIYADMHAHMIALPITIFAIGWIISILGRKWQPQWNLIGIINTGVTLFIGAAVIGALRPTNTWDFPTYLILAVVVLLYTLIRYGQGIPIGNNLPNWYRKILEIIVIVLVFAVLVVFLYKPFGDWFGQGYSKIDLWENEVSPFWSYFTHWGLFLFILLSWLLWETIQWMAETPLKVLNKLKPYRVLIYGFLISVVFLTLLLLYEKIIISWLVFPMAAWALVLIFRPDQPDAKRLVLFMIGTGLVLTLFVELFVLHGDIGRMNTVFKFYMQAWVLFAISAAVGLVWCLPTKEKPWEINTQNLWISVFIVLFASAAMYPLFATAEKIRDRMNALAPETVDGMAYMQTAHYYTVETDLDLSLDYDAIRWMQDNVQGSPVIVEAQTVEYQWGSRFSIYTGLPTVVGWNWHQRQQRAVTPSTWVTDRVDEVATFYLTTDITVAKDFLKTYNVKYIILGEYERVLYPGQGLIKFEDYDQDLWNEVYRDGEMVIYEVIS